MNLKVTNSLNNKKLACNRQTCTLTNCEYTKPNTRSIMVEIFDCFFVAVIGFCFSVSCLVLVDIFVE